MGRDCAKRAAPVWCFPWSLNHFHNLVRFPTEGCEDSHIKTPKDIPGYLKEERILLRKTRRKHLDYPKVKKDFEKNPKEKKILPEGNRRDHLDYLKMEECLF